MVRTQDAAGVRFDGSRRLLEYELVNEALRASIQGNTSMVQVVLEFSNLFGYYISTTFVPSLMLVIVCYLTLFFDLADFQDRIMVSLTAMLLLATFFSQTSLTMPRTSYLKLIDVWYLALISEDFLIIVVLVLVENLRLRQEALKVQVFPVQWKVRESLHFLSHLRTGADRAAEINRKVVLIFPVTLLVFLVIFFSVCFSRN
ncbi:glutamate-gated chloride channel alpha-like [Cherax quadricarinatus]|uniref:glutamate-gated chloride channel alpha-like n=1 Tax=Cherax quadricarinatus TaxID=27406 RepID=UPI00387E3F26